MTVTMAQVRSYLERDETPYGDAARLGEAALPHLEAIMAEPDPNVAARAVFLAGMIGSDKAIQILAQAQRRDEAVVRVAVASVLSLLRPDAAVSLFSSSLNDVDTGVRDLALKALPDSPPSGLRRVLESQAINDPVPALRDRAGAAVRAIR